jgi:hypothetical protein
VGYTLPEPNAGTREIEIRPLFEASDFGEAVAPEMARGEARPREFTANR